MVWAFGWPEYAGGHQNIQAKLARVVSHRKLDRKLQDSILRFMNVKQKAICVMQLPCVMRCPHEMLHVAAQAQLSF